jgi:hypothetical protein
MVWVAFYFFKLSIPHIRDDTASAMAAGSRRPGGGANCVRVGIMSFLIVFTIHAFFLSQKKAPFLHHAIWIFPYCHPV